MGKFEHIGKFENNYADDVNFTELNLEIAKFNRSEQCFLTSAKPSNLTTSWQWRSNAICRSWIFARNAALNTKDGMGR